MRKEGSYSGALERARPSAMYCTPSTDGASEPLARGPSAAVTPGGQWRARGGGGIRFTYHLKREGKAGRRSRARASK